MSKNTHDPHTPTGYLKEVRGTTPSPPTTHTETMGNDTFATTQRLSVLETLRFCAEMTSGMIYRPTHYRPDPALTGYADEYLHQLMGYRAEHSDPLAF